MTLTKLGHRGLWRPPPSVEMQVIAVVYQFNIFGSRKISNFHRIFPFRENGYLMNRAQIKPNNASSEPFLAHASGPNAS
eukprot:COSAG02_NODE_9499_length_2197_cov_2.425167_2_plen_79_part_00